MKKLRPIPVPIIIAFIFAVFSTTTFYIINQDLFSKLLSWMFLYNFFFSFLLISILLELFIYKEIDKIYNIICVSIKKKNFEKDFLKRPYFLNPLKRVKKELFQFIDSKQNEINQLKKTEAFRREFIADISHELKTPIFAAQGFVHTLLDGAVKDKSVRTKFLKRAARSLDGLDVLVQDLLTLSQIETGEIKMNFEYFDIKLLVIDIIDQFENKADKKDIKLTLFPNVEPKIIVIGDSQRIKQVLNNLISNAIIYSKDQSKIKIGFKILKKEVEIFVQDTGVGIPKKDVNRIFERFYRVDKSRSREKGGTGLGLAIVKHIIEEHKSKIEVKSTYGEGSIFSFKLKLGKNH